MNGDNPKFVAGCDQFGLDICKTLGLNGMVVRSLNIHIEPNDYVTVTCEYLINPDQADDFTTEFKKYRLVEVEK